MKTKSKIAALKKQLKEAIEMVEHSKKEAKISALLKQGKTKTNRNATESHESVVHTVVNTVARDKSQEKSDQ